MQTTETELGQLTAQDIKAIRQCDRACFYHSVDGGSIRLVKQVRDSGPFDDRERDYTITPRDSTITDYGNGNGHFPSPKREGYKCFEMAYNYSTSPMPIASLAAFLRAGDRLALNWVADGTDYTRESGLHLDQLTVIVRRKSGKESRDYAFLIGFSVCPDNTARMIQKR